MVFEEFNTTSNFNVCYGGVQKMVRTGVKNEQNALYTCMKFSKKNNLKCIPMTSLRYRRYGQNIHHEYCFYT